MSLEDLIVIYDDLKSIKEYLIKVGPARRQYSESARNKFSDAKVVYDRLEPTLSVLNSKLEEPSIKRNFEEIQSLVKNIGILYKSIISLREESESTSSEMASQDFDLKTAIALLPTMNNQEQVTLQLIDSIQLYSSMISTMSHKLLIEFVLKTRLSASAKLRLKTSYSSVSLLLNDMRTHLIQQKSSVALQTKIQNSKQGSRSIEKFGSDLEKLFVDLTISQAEGDDQKFDILRPLNEKVAIKRFSDGLSDSRLSTIIASRNFSSLPEAIRAAVDEQTLGSDENHLMSFQNNRYPAPRFSGNRTLYRGRGNYNYHSRNSENFPHENQSNQGFTGHRHQQWRDSARGHAQGMTRGGRGGARARFSRVQHTQVDTQPRCTYENQSNKLTQFFRAHTE